MSTDSIHASIDSQLGNADCNVNDSIDMFCLREADDYASCVTLGDKLCGQYRIKEAISIYEKALLIRKDDVGLYKRLGGAYLSLLRFEDSMQAYKHCLLLGAAKKDISFQLGIWYYLFGDYAKATEFFFDCLPCDDEQGIVVIYWHTLSCYRWRHAPSLLQKYRQGMKIGHHVAYGLATDVFSGLIKWETALKQAEEFSSPVDYITVCYGIYCYLIVAGKLKAADICIDKLLSHEEAWLCVPYLAAWNDTHKENC